MSGTPERYEGDACGASRRAQQPRRAQNCNGQPGAPYGGGCRQPAGGSVESPCAGQRCGGPGERSACGAPVGSSFGAPPAVSLHLEQDACGREQLEVRLRCGSFPPPPRPEPPTAPERCGGCGSAGGCLYPVIAAFAAAGGALAALLSIFF